MEYLFSVLLVTFFIVFILFVSQVSNKKIKLIIINILALILIIWKITEFTYYGINDKKIYPVEFSHISYFVVSICILTQIKTLRFSAGYFALISGLGYFITAIVSPKSMINSHDFPIFIMGVISHMTLLFIGLVLLFNFEKYHFKHIYIPYILLTIVIVYGELASHQIIYKDLASPDAYIFINILNGNVLNKYLSISDPIYGWLTTVAILLTMCGLIPLLMWGSRISKKSE